MRSNVATEASFSTRVSQWWAGIPFITSGVVLLCGVIYFICLLFGYDSYSEICFWPSQVISHVQVYRAYTSVLFHGSILHVVFNMMALLPIGSALERIMGSVRYLHIILVLATCNALMHLFIAFVVGHNPIRPYGYFLDECTIGFSGIIFSMIVMEGSLNGNQPRSVFGFFYVPAQWYPWILLILFQLLMSNVSLLGHLCGILSGFAYSYGLLNFFLFGQSTYSAVESSRILSSCVRCPSFIVGGGGTGSYVSGSLPSFSTNAARGAGVDTIMRSFSSWMPQRETTQTSQTEEQQDPRFPGRGRTLGANQSRISNESELQTRLLDRTTPRESNTERLPISTQPATTPNTRGLPQQAVAAPTHQAGSQNVDAATEKLMAMGFEKVKAQTALAAANGDLALAIEFLSGQD